MTNALPSLLQLPDGVLHLTGVTAAVALILMKPGACGMLFPIYANILTGACRIPAFFTDKL